MLPYHDIANVAYTCIYLKLILAVVIANYRLSSYILGSAGFWGLEATAWVRGFTASAGDSWLIRA